DASNAEAAEAAETLFSDTLDPPEDAEDARKIGMELEAIAKGRALPESRLSLAKGTIFHVLGLSPNAARLSVRFWLTDDFEVF
ncbi:type I-C CRISPR-associated protein Cas8c/Csd1, partial [Klebsiella pneumoniae]|uniref:type I-C CRISPR-associated protein Cas8c/Csd1 n=1 Tax=Klebsiella pneumoniae TaxID=573 RepID=UPI003EDEC044